MPAVAISATGNLFGALEFATRCSAAGVEAIIGCEIALELARRPDRIVALESGR
jgi:DNA polymerase-3 subunit alpha